MTDAPYLNVDQYLEAFGGRRKLLNRLKNRFALTLSMQQISKWAQRESIPGSHLVALNVLGSELDPPVKMSDYITNNQPKQKDL